jgi:hypothetical protein
MYDRLPPVLDPIFVDLYERALPMLVTRSNDSHARISCQYVLSLLEAEGGDHRIALPAIILHDVGWSSIPESEQRDAFGPGSSNAGLNRKHELEGAAIARTILDAVGYPRGLSDEICRIILTHDSKPEATTVEEAIVKDADKVWRVSHAGFPIALRLIGDMTPQQFHDFVAIRVPRWFLTETARATADRELAARRREFGLDSAPDVPPPGGYGIGDAHDYSS